MKNVIPTTYGIVLCAMIGIAAAWLSEYLSIESVALAILIGIIFGNSVKVGERFKKGIIFSEKSILSMAIVFMGVKLDYATFREIGYKPIALIIFAMVIIILSSVLLARFMKWNMTLALLLGIGSGVCGSSAIAATENIVGARKEDVGTSIAVINLLGTLGIFLLPLISLVLKLTDVNTGILIGNTLQSVGNVTAGGFSISETAGQTALIIKMGRILMLTPIILILLVVFSHKTSTVLTDKKGAPSPKVPRFILGFMLFSLISTFHVLTKSQVNVLGDISHYALILAMAGVGMNITFASIIRNGKSALLIGSVLFSLQIILTSSAVLFLF